MESRQIEAMVEAKPCTAYSWFVVGKGPSFRPHWLNACPPRNLGRFMGRFDAEAHPTCRAFVFYNNMKSDAGDLSHVARTVVRAPAEVGRNRRVVPAET